MQLQHDSKEKFEKLIEMKDNLEINEDYNLDIEKITELNCDLECSKPISIMGVQNQAPIAWSVDGNHFAYVAENCSIFITSEQKRFEIERTLDGHHRRLTTILFHPQQPILVSAGIEGIYVWDWQKGTLLKILNQKTDQNAHTNGVECLSWLYDGSILVSGSRDHDIKVWDVLNNFKFVETIHGHKAPLLTFEFCKERNLFASAGRDSTIKLWNVTSLHPSWRGKRNDDQSIRVQLHKNLDGHRGDVTSLLFNKKGTILFSGARDNEIKVWDIELGANLRSIKGHKGDVRNIYFFGTEEYLLTASCDSTIRLWKLAKNETVEEENKLIEVDELISDLSNLTDLISLDQEVPKMSSILVEKEKDVLITTIRAHDFDITSMSLHPSNAMVATSTTNNCVRVWDISNVQKVGLRHEFIGHRGSVNSVRWVRGEEMFISASQDYEMFLYDTKTSRRMAGFSFEGSILCTAVLPNQNLLLAGGNHYDIKGYSIEKDTPELYKLVVKFVGHVGKVDTIAISPKGNLMASGGQDFNIILWPLSDRRYLRFDENNNNDLFGEEKITKVEPLTKVDAHNGQVTCISFNADGDLLVSSGADHSIILWQVRIQKLSQLWKIDRAHDSVTTSVRFGFGRSSGLIFSSSWDSSIKVWPVEKNNLVKNNTPLKTLRGHRARVTDICLSQDGEYLLSSSTDSNVILWESSNPFSCVVAYRAPTTERGFNCVSAGKELFLTGSENGVVRVWPLYNKKYAEYFKKIEKK